uniref:Uncharacterized protein n=2 Tax=Trichobilharzia regenti TaxID=157069 RepID=A0AA85JC66_TRIRE|nr:unnamed protein product [Trichobilharzia regenti]
MIPSRSKVSEYKDFSSDSANEDGDWLSTSALAVSFVEPVPSLQNILQKIGISCQSTGHFFFAKMPFLSNDDHMSSSSTPWAVAHSAQKRCRYLEGYLKSQQLLREKLVQELRQLAVVSNRSVSSSLLTFSSLLCPLRTNASDSEVDTPADDVLVLFGSPATVFQILLFTPCLSSDITKLVLELVSNQSLYSEQLLEQFQQPVGLSSLFSCKQVFSDVSTRLLEVFQIIEEPRIRIKILRILPDLASSSSSSGWILSDEDRSLLVLQLVNLVDSICLENHCDSTKDSDPVVCLIECLTYFFVQGELKDRLYIALFNLLDRCIGLDSYFYYLPVITRCLLINGPAVPQSPIELSKLVSRLRSVFSFAKSNSINSAVSINSSLVDVLRVAFQLNRSVLSEWVRIIGLPNSMPDSLCQSVVDGHNQFVQDFIVLCISVSIPSISASEKGNIKAVSDGSLFKRVYNPDSYHNKRLRNEIISNVRRLLIAGKLFSFGSMHCDIDTFLADYGELLISGDTRLFSSFSFILNQLIMSGSCVATRFKYLTRYIGLCLYMKVFNSSKSDYSLRQEIISNLIHHYLTGINSLLIRSANRFHMEAIMKAILITILRLAQSNARELGVYEANLRTLQNQIDFSGASCDSGETRFQHSRMLHGYQSGILNDKQYIRHIFSILACVAFGSKEHRKQQDDLLSFIRKLLSSESLFSKCVGIIGAVVLIEVICRRDNSSRNEECPLNTACPEDEDDYILLASQLAHIDNDQSSTFSANVSRSSNASSLSLKGPGTGFADDPNEINLLAGDSEEDRTTDISTHRPQFATPPTRLLLQLVGLVEHAIHSQFQLTVFWLDELAFCFNRITQFSGKNKAIQFVLDSTSPSVLQFSEEAKNFIVWMGTRVMRDFQDDFVLDNASTENFTTQFSLHNPRLCEIAIALGPTWNKYLSADSHSLNGGNSSGRKSNRVANPLLLPAYLNLLAISEAVQHDGNLNTIDALLGCPLLLPTEFADTRFTKLLLGDNVVSIKQPHLLMIIINWFIETINVFAPKLPCVDSSNSQTFSLGAISSANMSNANRIHYLSILLRFTQIAKLRYSLYSYLASVFDTNNVQQQDADVDTETEVRRTQVSVAPVNKSGLSWSDLRLPTASFQPAMCYSSVPSTSYGNGSGQPFVTCGVHLQSFLSNDGDCLFARKRTGTSSKFSSCANRNTSRAVDVGAKKRKKILDTKGTCENRDSYASELSDSSVSQNDSNITQRTDSQVSQVCKTGGKKSARTKLSKMALVGTRKGRKSSKHCVTVCELFIIIFLSP